MLQGAAITQVPKSYADREAEVREKMITDKILQSPPELQLQLLDAFIQYLEKQANKAKP